MSLNVNRSCKYVRRTPLESSQAFLVDRERLLTPS
jgi:hypothetical protein